MADGIRWKFGIDGAEEAASQMREVGEATDQAGSKADNYSKTLRQQSRDARAVINEERYKANIMIASNPAMLQATRSAQLMGSFTRTSTAALNAYNIMLLGNKELTAQLSDEQGQLARDQLAYNDAVRRFGPDSAPAMKAMEAMHQDQIDINNTSKEIGSQKFGNFLTLASTFGMMSSQIVTLIPRMVALGATGPVVAAGLGATAAGEEAVTVATTGFSFSLRGLWAALGPVGLAIIGLSIAIPALIEYFPEISGAVTFFWQSVLVPFGQWLAGSFLGTFQTVWNTIYSIATNVWNNLHNGFVTLWNGFAKIANSALSVVASAVSGFVNMWIDGINSLIAFVNSIADVIHIGHINLIPRVHLTAPAIPTIAAAAGFSGVVSSPTLFLAGEAGQSETVNIGRASSGSGQTVIIHNNIAGSVWSEKELTKRVFRKLDTDLQDRGF